MGTRFRKSLGLGKGARITVGKRGVSGSVGIPGFRMSVHSSGRVTRTVGVPGTGLYSVSRVGGGRTASGRAVQTGAASYQLPKPGMFAGKAEKRYYEGVVAMVQRNDTAAVQAFIEAAGDPTVPSAHLLAAVVAARSGAENAVVRPHLEAALASDEPMPDHLQMKYLLPLSLSVRITSQIASEFPIDPVGGALMLAEVYQADGRLEEAIGLVQRLAEIAPDNPVIRLSLCDLLLEDGDYEGVLEASAGAVNDGDLGVATLHLRGAALFGLGQPGAAAEAFTAALAKTAGRDAALQTIIRLDRGIAYEGAGNARKARTDYERVVATDPANADARERLAALAL